jgi:hypothetical protein
VTLAGTFVGPGRVARGVAATTANHKAGERSMEQFPISINTLGALVTAGLGLFGLFLPASAASFAGIIPDGERGISEVRATYGGLFLAMGVFALIAQSSDVFRVVGVAWLGAAGARAFSVVRDNSRSGANIGGIVMEAAIGMSMLLPWSTFTGA